VGYQLGVDIGTTFTAAAIHHASRARIVRLSDDDATIPTVVSTLPGGSLVVGCLGSERLRTHPELVAREFKRRIGDPTPIELGPESHQASWYMAQVLAAVAAAVAAGEGEPPNRVALTHPANWSGQKITRLLQAVSEAGLDPEATVLLTEPEAAARAHAATRAVTEGEVIAVYDLGGGTFDTAVLRRAGEGYEMLGRPEGIERLGGLDFDMALFRYVTHQLGHGFKSLDLTNPPVARGVVALRDACVQAKERLSFVTEIEVAVEIPDLAPRVEVDRRSFEALVRPALMETIGALRRALAGAAVEAEDVSQILIAGGSSRIPLVAELIAEVLERPVAIDRDPKHVVALGAAHAAADAGDAASSGHAGPFADERAGDPSTTGRPAPPIQQPADPVVAEPVGARPAPPTPTTSRTRVAPSSTTDAEPSAAPRPERGAAAMPPATGATLVAPTPGAPTSVVEAEPTDTGDEPAGVASDEAGSGRNRQRRRWAWPRSRR